MPTIKQKQAFEKVVKGSSLTKAMKDVGYAESTSKRTNKLTNTDGWNELLEKHISDKKLTKVLNEGLEATRQSGTGGMKIGIGTDGKVNDMGHTDIEYPDYAVRHKYLETGLKLKSKFPDPKLNLDASDDLKDYLSKLNKLLG